jgi:hypothetical protein
MFSLGAYAQDSDVSYLETQNTISSAFSIPVTVNEKGEFKIMNNDGNLLSVGPLGQFSLSRSNVQYILPIRQNSFSFIEQDKDLGWMEIKRNRFEIGLGLQVLLAKNMVSLGFSPFKGSYQVMMREKNSRNEKTGSMSLPQKLSEMNGWRVGDQGSFQTYGGIQAFASVGLSYFNIASAALVLQNQFIIDIRKVGQDNIILSIGEENINRRRISSGATLASIEFSKNKGKLLTTQFVLSLSKPEHQKLYEKALAGKLTDLQKALPSNAQKIEWVGTETVYYFGIPYAFGKSTRIGHYDIDENGMNEDLDIRIKSNHGVLVPQRSHKKMVYQTDKNIILFWTSEMNRTHTPAIERNFLSYGRAIGISGFENEIPDDTNFGSTVTHLGLAFTKDEVELMKDVDVNDLSFFLKQKCEEERLKCSKKKHFGEIINNFKNFVVQPWLEVRHDLGKLLSKEPALIFALVKSLKLEKKVYFKFLSEKFQSIEGTAVVEL